MPIDADLLERIKSNDSALKNLDLSNRELNDKDIEKLAEALVTNTSLTTLDVSGNHIGDEGARALAANTTLIILDVNYNQIGAEGAKALATNTSLTILNVSNNRIGDEGAKALATNTSLTTLDMSDNRIGDEGAKALATNPSLTTLDVSNNRIGDEGAKALATNTTLTTLNIIGNPIGDDWQKALTKAIARNNQQVVTRRQDQFIQTLVLLAYDQMNKESQSLWSRLPQELMVYIISLMPFRSVDSIGKSAQQIQSCAEFMFNHVAELKVALAEAINTKQDFKLVEKRSLGKSQFRFFPYQSPIKPSVIQEEIKVDPNKIKNVLN